MKKVLLLLLMWVSVMQVSFAQGFCNNQSFITPLSTSLGSPVDGPYKPCEEVLFCYNVIDFNSQGCNWLHAIVPDFGDCWDQSSFSPFFAGAPNDILTLPTNNSGNGVWTWYEDGEINYNNISGSLPPGGSVGAGWFYYNFNLGPGGSDAGDTWGDGFFCNSQGLTWNFCFSMITNCDPNCDVNDGLIDCQMSFKTFSDGETGGRTQADCVFDPATNFDFNLTCCQKPTLEIPQTYAICSGEPLIIDFPTTNPDVSYYWTVSNLSGVVGAGNGGGVRLEQTLTNTSAFPQVVSYTIIPINSVGGCNGDPVLIEVTVEPDIIVNVSGNNLVCQNECVTLFASTNGDPNSTYEWSNGFTGGPFLDDCTGIFETTTYTVTITSPNGCTGVGELTVEPAPFIFVSAGPDVEIPCGENSILIEGFSEDGNVLYDWSLNGVSISDQSVLEATEAGTYSFTVLDIYGCQYFDQVEVTLAQGLAGVDAGADTYLPCGATNIGLDASDSPQGPEFVYAWSTNDGAILFDGTTLFPIVEEGTYTLTVINTQTGCSATDDITVFPSIAGTIASPEPLDCNTTSVLLDGSASSNLPGITYQWSTNDGNIVNGADTNIAEVDAPGTYTLMVTDTIQDCSASTDVVVEDNAIAPLAEAGADQAINCIVSSPTLDASGSASGANITYAWTGPNGFSSADVSITVNEVGTYVLLVTNTENGCTATDATLVFEDLVPPVAEAGNIAYLNCFNGPLATLDGSQSSQGANFTYEWLDASGTSIGNTASVEVDLVGTYTLTVVNTENGCVASDVVNVEDGFSIELTTTEVNCEEDDGTASLTLVGINNPVYDWSNGATTATVYGLAPGEYRVTISGGEGSCTEVRDVRIEADLSCKVYIGGYAYADFIINNCELDDLEEGLEGITVNLLPLGISTQTDANGYYEFEVNTGDYIIEVEEQAPYILQCPIDGMIEVSLPDTSDVSLDNHFYFQVITDFDLTVSANSGSVQPGELQSYNISYCNFGVQTINGILRFTHDPQMIFDPIASGASSYDPATFTATWNFSNLPFLACQSVSFKMQAPADLPVGTTIVSTVTVTPTIGDLNPLNNSKTWSRTVQGSSVSLVIGNNHGQTKATHQPTLNVHPNFPNPFVEQTTLAFELAQEEAVRISIFDSSGRLVREMKGNYSAGYHEWQFDASRVDSKGLLYYRIETSTESFSGKMMKM
ncbi:MAG: PKD-like domain-containing protein [Bacteroidota bacterium]